MQKSWQNVSPRAAQAQTNTAKTISVEANECRLARHGERLIARHVLSDVVVTVQAAGFTAMLRFSVPEQPNLPRPRLQAYWSFADQALGVLFESIRSMGISSEQITVSAVGGADIPGQTFGHGRQLSLAVQRALWRHRIPLHAEDLGGNKHRLVWLESSSGRLIVRSTLAPAAPALSRQLAS